MILTMHKLITWHWITLHGLIVMLGLAIYVTSSHTLHLRRHPSAAIAWVAALILLPYAALPMYLIFGIRKVKCYKPQKSGDAMTLRSSNQDSLLTRTQQLAAIMQLPPASTYQQLNIHEDGTQALNELRKMLNEATKTIDLCTFIFARDNLGDEIAQILKQRARDGIRVRLLIDGIGAYLGSRADLNGLTAAGVHVTLFVPPLRSSLRGRTNLRNHRKMAIIDSKWLWCGGRNLATEYFEGSKQSTSPPWLDLSFDLQGALALDAEQQFEQDWQFATQGLMIETSTPPNPNPPPEAATGQLITSGPDQKDDTLYTLLVSGFFLSKKRILVVTPYFVPDQTLLMSLTLAARRGVKVDFLMPNRSNHRMADIARHRALRELTAAGAHIWFLPQMIHAKAIIIDDELAMVGSANLDERSLFLNYELMFSFYNPTDVSRFTAWIEQQKNTAVLYRAQPPGIWQEIAEGLLLWLAFQL